MTTFNTNLTSGLGARTTIGPTKIRSPTRYSDMFVGAQSDVIESMLEGYQQEPAQTKKKAAPAKNLTRYERLTNLRNNNRDIQTIPDVHYRVVESIPDAMDAALELANYHSVSVLWEGFDVNRHGVLTWIICGYLGSAVLFNIRKFGAKIFTEGGLKRLLEARHPIKVIHDCSCLADILFNQYDVELRAESIFDTHAADLLIQSKTSQQLTAKTLTECLIEYQDIPVSVYRQRESILRRDPSIWVWENIPPELLLVTARMARYAVLLHGIMLRELSKPLPQITEIYLNCRIQENSPDPKTRIRQILPDVESLLMRSKQIPILKTDWNIPESILNPAYESQPGDEHFYSKPFKFDPKKATPGSLRIFSVNPNRPVIEDDNDWEKYVHGAPNYGPAEEEDEEPEEEETTESKECSIGDMFKVPDIFSDVTSSSAGCEGDVTSHNFVTSRNIERVTDDDQIWSSNSSSDDNVNFIIPECEPPPTVAATMDPSRLGSRTIFAGDPRYNDPAHKAPVMSPELSKLVEKIRAEQKSESRSRAFITAEEMRRNLEEERRAFSNRYTPEPDRESHHSSEVARITEKTENLVKLIEPHYKIASSSSSSSDVIVDQGCNAIPQCFIEKPFNSAVPTSPRQPFQMSSSRFQTPINAARAINSSESDIIGNLSFHHQSPTSVSTSLPPPLVQVSPQTSMSPHKSPAVSNTMSPVETCKTQDTTRNQSRSFSKSLRNNHSSEKLENNTSQIPTFSDLNTPTPRSVSSGSGPQRQPLIIIPKSRAGRGRGNPQQGRIPPLLVSSISKPQSSAPARLKGRGRAAAIANRAISHDFLTEEQCSVASSVASSASGSIYHCDFYGPGVTVIPDTFEVEKSSSGGYSNSCSTSSAHNGGRSHKQPVSMCFAYDSDDPDNY